MVPGDAQGAQRGQVLVALRHEAQEVADRLHAELREALGDFRADAGQPLNRPSEQ